MGYRIDYRQNPYAGYQKSGKLWFDISHRDKRYKRKEWVIATVVNGILKAYTYKELKKTDGQIVDTIAGAEVVIEYDKSANYAVLHSPNSISISPIYSYWFSWIATYPNSEVYQHPR